MTEQSSDSIVSPPAVRPARAPASRSGRLALLVALIALAASAAQWFGLAGRNTVEPASSEDLARVQRRLNSIEERVKRERNEVERLAAKVGSESPAEDSLSGRLAALEAATARQPGGENVRFLWLVEQAEYFMRIANAQENLAGNVSGALTALEIADEYLRDAADPRLLKVRKLLASDIKALRAVPRVDTEGIILRLGSLNAALAELPRIRTAPAQFSPQPVPPPAEATGLERARQALRNAFMSIVSIRRTDTPTATLLSEESENLMIRGLELEIQMARLALLRGDARVFRLSVAAVRDTVETYFDTTTTAGSDVLEVLDEIAGVQLPESLPDISASLAELLRLKEREKNS